MAVTSREIRVLQPYQSAAPWVQRSFSVVHLATLLVGMLAIYVLVGWVVAWGQVRLDDLRYGRPRTMHLSGFVGRAEEAHGQPTHFIAMNLNQQVIVLELPGSDPTRVRSWPGPYLFGAHEHLTPVIINLADVDGDGLPDVLLNVRNEQVVYLNRDGGLRLPTPEERTLLRAP